ncbi:protein IN2-1 B-like protein isoform X5 [Cinnamomum micranthum f. kanehirae]|uniref:Protein IN2-1 B-like protein isoform X5 n=1 Tax=Cinnamomum micranthum f. kanehirae TaxID=337451 RepID=A0A443PJE7_9MAGN|nr:protein IN2-1 B-like protein isoform X5 [Cinnamomum micranthum f. kanehirae]
MYDSENASKAYRFYYYSTVLLSKRKLQLTSTHKWPSFTPIRHRFGRLQQFGKLRLLCFQNTKLRSYISSRRPYLVRISLSSKATRAPIQAMAMGKVKEVPPPVLDSNSEPPNLFDGTTRLYISYTCPYAQRVWIARNYKGLQDVIKLVPIDLQNRPAWYKEKVYPANKVPSLEHNNEVKGESLELVKYIDSNFEGPSLLPDDIAKRVFAEEMLSYTDTFNTVMRNSFSLEGGVTNEIGGAFDHLENALSKFEDGPFFLGQFSLVDIAYVPFIERFYLLLLDVKNYDITIGRAKLKLWIQEMIKIDGYAQTRQDPQELLPGIKKRYMVLRSRA